MQFYLVFAILGLMKKDIHPKYYNEAKIKCACGAEYVAGSTQSSLAVEACSACHPFYTGKGKILDIAGRVEKFKARAAAAQKELKSKTPRKNSKKEK